MNTLSEQLKELEVLRDDLKRCNPRDKQARQVLEIIDWALEANSTIQSLRDRVTKPTDSYPSLTQAVMTAKDEALTKLRTELAAAREELRQERDCFGRENMVAALHALERAGLGKEGKPNTLRAMAEEAERELAAAEKEQGLRDENARLRLALQRVIEVRGERDKVLITAQGALSQPPQSPWRPIAEAPKDGTEIILYSPERPWKDAPCVGQNASTIPERVTSGQWIESLAEEDTEDYSGWGSLDGGFTNEHPPTHWMPLPKPPTKGES